MKKFLVTIVLLVAIVAKSLADEGMWLPLLLGEQVYTRRVRFQMPAGTASQSGRRPLAVSAFTK